MYTNTVAYANTNEADDAAFKLVNNSEHNPSPLDVYYYLSLVIEMLDTGDAKGAISDTDRRLLFNVYSHLGTKLEKKQRAADRLSRLTVSN